MSTFNDWYLRRSHGPIIVIGIAGLCLDNTVGGSTEMYNYRLYFSTPVKAAALDELRKRGDKIWHLVPTEYCKVQWRVPNPKWVIGLNDRYLPDNLENQYSRIAAKLRDGVLLSLVDFIGEQPAETFVRGRKTEV